MAASYRDLFKVNLKYIDYILAKSQTIHQYAKNIKGSGDNVESEIRTLLRRVLPNRYRVTHGYIAYAADRDHEPTVSPQVDVIIADTLVPHTLWVIDETQDSEIVPVEAVVGVIEVKRTLNRSFLQKAIKQLGDICAQTNITRASEERFLPGGIPLRGGIGGGYTHNPLLGVLSLTADDKLEDQESDILRLLQGAMPPLDIAASLSGITIMTADQDYRTLRPHIVRMQGDRIDYKITIRPEEKNRQRAVSETLGFIQAYLSQVCGRKLDPNSYFFNKHIGDVDGT